MIIFKQLQSFISKAEGHKTVRETYNYANKLVHDWYLGYQQISGHNLSAYAEYLKTIVPEYSKKFIDQFKLDVFNAVNEDLAGRTYSYSCHNFPSIFTLELQELFHCIYLAEAMKSTDSTTYEHLILANALGPKAITKTWTKDSINKRMYSQGTCSDSTHTKQTS